MSDVAIPMNEKSPPFVLSRATESDLNEIIHLEFDCFPAWIAEVFMGAISRNDLSKTHGMYLRKMQEDPHDIWIKVVDREIGSIIAASNWKVYVNRKSTDAIGEFAPPWLEGESLEKSKKLCHESEAARASAMPGPFVHLHICFTKEEHRRRGAGGMMLQWGCNLADQLGLPAWVEASDEGNLLYKAFGFYDFEKIEGELGGWNMKRDAKIELAAGGK